MAEMWVITVGFIICLGLFGGMFVYFLKSALNTEDSKRIDRLPGQERKK
ncbi:MULTISPECIES: hypothetical protein [Bacillus]|nr:MULTISPECIES: hypothetical protein [Bacillus]